MRVRWQLLCCLGWAPLVFGGDISPKQVIDNVEKTLIEAKTVKLTFEQTYVWEFAGEEKSISGELVLEGEDRFRVVTEDQVIVSDGETLWTHNKPSNQVLIDRLTNSDNTLLPRQILFQYKRDYRSRVEGEEDIFGKRCYILLFTAETGDTFISQIRAWVDKSQWIPRKIEQVDLGENHTTYLLQNIEIGIPLGNDFFDFIVPDGVDVIDMR